MSLSGARRIGSLINARTLRELGMPADVARLSEITAAWVETVGEALAGHVQPIRYVSGRLVLRASSAVWVSRVRHSHESLLHTLRQHSLFQDAVGLEVRAAPLARPRARTEARPARTLSAQTGRLLEAVAEDVADPALRAALQRLGKRFPR
jgi:hypothetical protein